MPQDNVLKTLDIGSYFGSSDKAIHSIDNKSEEDIILYVRTNGKVKVK